MSTELATTTSEPIGFWHVSLFSRVSGDENGCWNWQGHKDKLGYGKVRCRGKYMLAHRAAFMVVNGILPASLLVCHRCDNPSCINPSHLFLGTNRDNTMDAVAKGRQFIPPQKGEAHSQAILTAADVLEIRRLCAERKHSQREIGIRFGVTQPTVSDINTGRNWSHI